MTQKSFRQGDVAAVDLSWLVQLRWGAAASQLSTFLVVRQWMSVDLPLVPVLAVIGVEAASNVAFSRWASRAKRTESGAVGLVLAFDVVVFTLLLYLTGGAYNPFSFLYLIYITLAAVVLSPGWAWTLAAFSVACFRTLFVFETETSGGEHASHLQSHLEGMWIAFAVAAGFTVYFVQRVRSTLAAREAELAGARDLTARNQKLASLATLAAGAAHQLATPLSTIAVVSKELEQALSRDGARRDATEDARLIRDQVERCRLILSQMAVDAGQSTGEPLRSTDADSLIAAALQGLDGADRVDVAVDPGIGPARIVTPFRSLAQALRAILKNGLEASTGRVTVAVRRDGDWRIDVRDGGPGMAPEIFEHAGEPFFTTKGPDRGMGLGLFLTRAVVEGLGGRFEIESAPTSGTVVSLWIPERVASTVQESQST